MIETLKYATVSQISTKDLRFYDPKDISGSKEFCEKLGITYLPDANRKQFYELKDGSFVLKKLHEIDQCNPWDLIFSEETLAKFRKNNSDNVLFVTEDQRIKGVVHIVDYNREFIFTELYKLIFNFESMLREYLFNAGVNNNTIIEFFRQKSDVEAANSFWKRKHAEYTSDKGKKKLQEAMGPLQVFYLSDLLNYYHYLGKISDGEMHSIIRIRNKIAHSVDIISKERDMSGEKLYNFKGLSEFIKDVRVFFSHFEKLENGLREL